METNVVAKKIGGSLGVIIPKDLADKEKILENDALKIRIEKISNLDFLWGKFKDIKKSTDEIMKEIDEGELSD